LTSRLINLDLYDIIPIATMLIDKTAFLQFLRA